MLCRCFNASLPPSPGADGHFSFEKMSYGGSPEGPTPPPTRATGGSDAQAMFLGKMKRKLSNELIRIKGYLSLHFPLLSPIDVDILPEQTTPALHPHIES